MVDRSPPIQRFAVAAETSLHDQTNAYVVGEAGALLVDPAAIDPDLTAAVDARSVEHIAITHAHRDHVGAVDHYADRRGGTVWAHAGRTERFARATGRSPDRTYREGTAVGPATVIETPGHAPDHVAFRIGPEAVVGDLAVADGSIFIGGEDGDLRAYLVSLRRLLHAELDRLHPGHGAVIEDANESLQRLLAHRHARERRVLEAVRNGARSVDAVMDEAYAKDLTGVEELARLTVAAHLEKLDVEGHVTWDGRRAEPRSAARD